MGLCVGVSVCARFSFLGFAQIVGLPSWWEMGKGNLIICICGKGTLGITETCQLILKYIFSMVNILLC